MDLRKGLLILDDTTLDKPYARKMDLVTYHWSGKHQRVVKGFALLTLLWTEGQSLIPCNFRVYDKPQGGKTNSRYAPESQGSGLCTGVCAMDSWYSALKNLKLIASFGWFFLTRLKRNRLVNPDRVGNRLISKLEIPQ